jgi:DNA modification methylase
MEINKILQGDCLEELRKLPDKYFDLCLTDPPYNAKNIGPNKRTYSFGQMSLPLREYKKFCRKWFKEALRVSKRLVFTPGIANMCFYPQPKWAICWHKPAAVSFNRMGGYNAWEPIFIYGDIKNVRLPQDYLKVNTLNFTKGVEAGHPCPKPPELIGKLINIFSKEGEIILDPFMGSGTTAFMAQSLKRNWFGIEINPDYVKMTKIRLRQKPLL